MLLSVTTKLQVGGQKEGEKIKVYLGLRANHMNVFCNFYTSGVMGKSVDWISGTLSSRIHLATHMHISTCMFSLIKKK